MNFAARTQDSARELPRHEDPAGLSAVPRFAPTQRRPLRERLRMPLMLALPVMIAAAALYWYLTSGRYESTDDAYLRAAEVAVSANVSGRVSEVDVRDNERVHRGQILFRFDDRPFRIAVEAAKAHLAAARLQVESLKAAYRQRVADLGSAESTLSYAAREYKRQSGLLASGIASQSQVDRAQLVLNEARESVAAAQQQITAALARLDGNPNIQVKSHPLVEQAQAALDRALLDVSYTIVAAPSDGVVTGVDHLQVGSYLQAATPAFLLVSRNDVWVEADFKENQLGHIHPGESATVTIDAYPGRTFRAVVTSITPGTGSQFSVLPPENATGNWVKVVQRLDVRLHLAVSPPAVSSGLSAAVTVDTRSGSAEAHAAAAER
jgi:membrane fusion protein (multidrug efflux system)